jgi:hypothetical protein
LDGGFFIYGDYGHGLTMFSAIAAKVQEDLPGVQPPRGRLFPVTAAQR